jgi:hypothetical protein
MTASAQAGCRVRKSRNRAVFRPECLSVSVHPHSLSCAFTSTQKLAVHENTYPDGTSHREKMPETQLLVPAFLRGERVEAIVEEPRAVQGASMKATRSNAGRREWRSLHVSPGLLTT